MEYLDIVCPRTGEPTGESLSRPEALTRGAWCRSTNVYVLNRKGEILCHQRSLAKERLPGCWSTHLGGHVGAGEDYDANALKELEEESGIRLKAQDLVPWRTTRIDDACLWTKEYVALLDIDADELVPQPGEVERFTWRTLDQVLAAAEAEPDAWVAGTHDLVTEYHCMRSALTAVHGTRGMAIPRELHVWHPAMA